MLKITRAAALRLLRRAIGPLHRRRHRHTLHHAALTADALRAARDTFWGDELRWFPGGTPPRQGNQVTLLVDGERYFAALQEAFAAAQHYVYIAGWCLTPYIPLARTDQQALIDTRLVELLKEVASRAPVRILLWSGAPVFFQPTTERMEAVERTINDYCAGDMLCRLDSTAPFSHCHHQKTIVVDGQVAFVGGMDLTTFQGDRWDTQDHPLRAGPNWHDVQLRLQGEAVADVEANFRQRWRGSGGPDTLPHRQPLGDPSWTTTVQIVRTIHKGVYRQLPKGEFGIHYTYTRAIRAARRLIYLENQYLWSPDVLDALLAALQKQRDEPFRIVIVLPARAYSGKWDNDQHVQRLRDADHGRGIVSVYCPYASGPSAGLSPFTYRPTYVHAKVGIIDDEWLTVGSANLNNRGLITDSELNVVAIDPQLARRLRVELWAEHLKLPRELVDQSDPITLVDNEWATRSAENAEIIKRADRPLVCGIHRYETGRMPGSWLLEEAESLLVEL